MGKAGSIQTSTKRLQPQLEASWRSSLPVVPVFLLLSGLCYSRTRETAAASFPIDVDQPFTHDDGGASPQVHKAYAHGGSITDARVRLPPG